MIVHIRRWLRRAPLMNYLVLVLGAVFMLFPFLWMVSTSFKPRGAIFAFPPMLWPETFTLQNYANVLERLDLLQLYWNTASVTILKTALMVYTSALLGYVFGKYQFRWRELIFYLILLTMIIPLEVYVIPLYQMMVGAKLANTHLALVAPYVFGAINAGRIYQFVGYREHELAEEED